MQRTYYYQKIDHYFNAFPVVALLGPRQSGKTTLARAYFADQQLSSLNYFDLEDPADWQRLQEAKITLDGLTDLIVIDEVQHLPDLFKVLRVLVDEPNGNKQFLILGSASRALLAQSSESLAGRIAYIELMPFAYFETHDTKKLWLRGGFPRSYLATSAQASIEWRDFYITAFLEQDLPNLGIHIAPVTMRRFWAMLGHYHGAIFNASEIGRSMGVADTSVRHYLDILTGTFMVRQLQPFIANIKKRQVKAPKIYFRDSGIYHSIMGLASEEILLRHPKLGLSWEGYALEQIIRCQQAKAHECFFWATHAGAELDLLIEQHGRRIGFEFKYTDAPKLSKSMVIAEKDLALDQLLVIYPGDKSYPLSDKIQVMPLESYIDESFA